MRTPRKIIRMTDIVRNFGTPVLVNPNSVITRRTEMTQYENEFSSFPSRKITRHHFRNIDDTAAELVNRINQLRAQGSYSEAAALIDSNKEMLSSCTIDAVTFRTWEEEIYNTQIYARQVRQSIYFEADEDDFDCLEGDVWLGGS